MRIGKIRGRLTGAGLAAWLLAAFVAPGHAADSSYFAAPVSCSDGPYGLRLPATYEALRGIGTLREERVLPALPADDPAAEQRELSFNGLRLTILRARLDPESYRLLSAELSHRQWKIAGPLRVGGLLPARVADIDTRQLRGRRGVVEFIGESKDVLRVRRSGRRIASITYLCHLR
ncbi:MAG TPA: hypothetical protein VF211_10670 [Burkholderiales bacterium]